MHDHTHDHGHGHGYDHAPAPTREEAAALLRFTLHHNEHHEEELHSLAHGLEHLGDAGAANEVWDAMDDLHNCNEHLAAALELLERQG